MLESLFFWIVCLHVLNWIYPFICVFIHVHPATLIKKCRTGHSSHRTDWNKVCHQDDFGWWLSLTRTSTEGLLIITPLVLWMYKCSPCFPHGTTLMSVVCLTPTSLRRPDPVLLLKEAVKKDMLCILSFSVCVCLTVCQCPFFLLRLFHPMPGKRHSITGSSPIPVQNNLGHTKWNKKEGSFETRLGPRCKV